MAMIVNTAWLSEYLEAPCEQAELLKILPAIGLEIEKCDVLRESLAPVRVGFVRDKRELPNAPGMFLCEIEIARGKTIPVVCASEHEIRVGVGVPVAPAGTELPSGKHIRADQYHGCRSEGMICLDGELGILAKGSGLQQFEDASTLGAPLPDVAHLSEYLLEVNVLPNRPDFLGLIGIAREVAAALGTNLRLPAYHLSQSTNVSPPISVHIEVPDWCDRYLGGLIQGVKVTTSPSWFKSRLYLAGLRPINNIVDVTNYVMYEWGQPLHAFDFDTLRGGRIVVRRMRDGESLELLTSKMLNAPSGSSSGSSAANGDLLVIADAERPIALAGVMGGSPTQTTAKTTNILLEAAHFDPVQIRSTVNRVNLGMEGRGTQSSYRFERGTDPNSTLENAFRRAAHLIREFAGGAIRHEFADEVARRQEGRQFKLKTKRVASYLGKELTAATIRDCLQRLKMECSGDEQEIVVRVPTWRVDVNDPVVLIEDVARMIGYDQIPVAPAPTNPTLGVRGEMDRLRHAASMHLVANGFFETRNPSLESPDMSEWLGPAADTISLRNFETREMSVLRRSLLPGLASSVQNNIRRGATAVRLFEVDRAFLPDSTSGSTSDPTQIGRWNLAVMVGGAANHSNWRNASEVFDFYQAKGILEDLLESIGIPNVSMQAASIDPYLEGTCANLVASNGMTIGRMGEIDAGKLKIDRLLFRLFGFEIDLEASLGLTSTLPAYQALGRQPAVTRDLAFILPVSHRYDEIRKVMEQSAGPYLEQLDLIDRYQGPQVTAGHQSMAFHLVFRHPERTLTADEVAISTDQIVARVKQQFGGELREGAKG